MTVSPRSKRASAVCEPMKPVVWIIEYGSNVWVVDKEKENLHWLQWKSNMMNSLQLTAYLHHLSQALSSCQYSAVIYRYLPIVWRRFGEFDLGKWGDKMMFMQRRASLHYLIHAKAHSGRIPMPIDTRYSWRCWGGPRRRRRGMRLLLMIIRSCCIIVLSNYLGASEYCR